MPALVAMRFNADLQAKYNTLISAGKPPKVAITGHMRKLVVLAITLLRDNRKWVQKPLEQNGYFNFIVQCYVIYPSNI